MGGQNINLSSLSKSDKHTLETELSQIFESQHFKSAHKMRKFLRYIMDISLSGKNESLKQYNIAVDALGFPNDFDSDANPAVRILGGRVRERLHQYNKKEGKNSTLRITIPKGAYKPSVERVSPESIPATPTNNDVEVSQGPKLGVFCFQDDTLSKDDNALLFQIGSTVAKEMSQFIFSRLFVRIPSLYSGKQHFTGRQGKTLYNLDFSLLISLQKTKEGQYTLVYRLWDNETEEVIKSEFFKVHEDKPDEDSGLIVSKICSVVSDIFQGKLHIYWARRLLRKESQIPSKYQALAYFRHNIDTQTKESIRKASSFCMKALERDPKDIVANVLYADYCRRSYVYGFDVIENPLVKGKLCAETAIRFKPDSHEAYFELGQILFCMNEWKKCKATMEHVRSISTNFASIEYSVGFHYCFMGFWDEGMPIIEKVMSISDTYPDWYYLLPFLNYYRKEKYEEALIEANKIITPSLHGPLSRTCVYGKLGEIEKGKKELQGLIAIYPEFLKDGEGIIKRLMGSTEIADQMWEGLQKLEKT